MSIAIDTELMIKVEMASTFDLNEAFPILQQLFALRQQIADDILIHKYDRDSEAYRMLDHINDRIKYVLGL